MKRRDLPFSLRKDLAKMAEERKWSWLKPGIYGAVVGAIALAIVGFGWGGWVTGGTARQMANQQARQAVVAALAPICIEQSKQDPQATEIIAKIRAASSWERNNLLTGTGWATMPGSSNTDRDVAAACTEALMDQEES